MKIKFIKASYEIDMLGQTGIEKLQHIEKVARLCYKTEDRITDTSYIKLIDHLVSKNHTAMLEHASFAVKFICSRDFTHELVRHRIASFAQESQRYVGYGDAIQFIIPPWCDIQECEFEFQDWRKPIVGNLWDDVYNAAKPGSGADTIWCNNMCSSAQDYTLLLEGTWRPEQARSVLPNSTKTEIWIEGNLRTWMNIFQLRDAMAAAPAMRELMGPLHIDMKEEIPGVF